MTIKLVVKYRTPSLNVTKRQHWSKQYREKQKAWNALSSALLATASDAAIQIISPEVARICSTGYDMLRSYQAMSLGGLSSKRNKSKSVRSRKNVRK